MKVQQILDFIDSGDIALPEFQRGYVWNREQVRGLFTSLYRGYPVGGFMTWNTQAEGAAARGGISTDGTIKLLLDGQQRATSLYGVIRGQAPKFFEGNAQAFTGLNFNVVDQTFEFYAPAKMKSDPSWIDVSALMQSGVGAWVSQVQQLSGSDPDKFALYFGRLNAVAEVKNREMHIEEVTGRDKTIDVVVDIFNRVNSGGTKLSKGDLALAKICAALPEARKELNTALQVWKQAGFNFSLDWLLRVVNGVITGKAPFAALAGVTPSEFQKGLAESRKYVSQWLDVIGARVGLDHDRVLFSKPALVILARHTHLNGGKLPDAAQQDRLLYWFLHTGMWGRYAGSTETVLSTDLDAVKNGGTDELIRVMAQSRGDLVVRESDFAGSSMGARFYPTLYMLTRTQGARDFGTGVVLSSSLLGKNSSLEVHHVFPKKQLYAKGYERHDVNAVANFCFLTKQSNIAISATPPATYMPVVESTHPGALTSQWVPSNPVLWDLDQFPNFLSARRALLAKATNDFLDGLLHHTQPVGVPVPAPVTVSMEEPDEQDDAVEALLEWLAGRGYARPEVDAEVSDPQTGEVICTAEAHWPAGFQPGIGSPVVLELDEGQHVEERLTSLGYRVFTSVEGVREYVTREEALW
jgi:hypothetical protein